MTRSQPAPRPQAKTKTELREMLAEAVRNTQPAPRSVQGQNRLVPKDCRDGRCWTVVAAVLMLDVQVTDRTG